MAELTARDFENIHLLIEKDFKFRLGGGVRDSSTLESIADRPEHGFYSTNPHPSIFDKAASIFEGIVCWHPFVDGNKRTALVITRVYLAEHGYSFFVPFSAVRFSVQIAQSTQKKNQETQEELDRKLKYIARWIGRHSAKPNTFLASMKFNAYVMLPMQTMILLSRHGLAMIMVWFTRRWFAFDIYPEYRAEFHKTMVLLMQLDADSLSGRREFKGIGRRFKRLLTRTSQNHSSDLR
jgi:death-on-curing protein